MLSIVKILVIVLLSHAGDASPQALPLEPSVMDTPVASELVELAARLSVTKIVPNTVADAGRQMLAIASGDFRDDIVKAAASATKLACTGDLASYSGRLRALSFSEHFWRALKKGKIYGVIRRHASSRDNVDLEFAEFYEKYLAEFARSWDMRSKASVLTNECRSYGVDDVNSCLKVMLLSSVEPGACATNLADHMYVYLSQPLRDEVN